nr:MAG TPA: hypothetical protein [Caudoviricetes sp.]
MASVQCILGRFIHIRRSPRGPLWSGTTSGSGYWMNETRSASHSCMRWRVYGPSILANQCP